MELNLLPEQNTLSFVVGCKGRLAHLKQTLPALVAQKNAEIIVVDYDCPDQTAAWVEASYPSVRVVREYDQPHFCLARCRNVGLAAAKNEWVCFIDADILIGDDFADRLFPHLVSGTYGRFSTDKDSPFLMDQYNLFGTIIVERSVAKQIGGYDEAFKSWGGEDLDFYARLKSAGTVGRSLNHELIQQVIGHSDDLRMKYYPDTSLQVSETASTLYRLAKHHLMRDEPLSPKNQEWRERLYSAAEQTVQRALASNSAKATLVVNQPDTNSIKFKWANTTQKIVIEIEVDPLKRQMKSTESVGLLTSP